MPADRKHSETYIQLGRNIALYRKAYGLSQAELARRVNISRTHLSNIEAAGMKKSVSLDVLMDIAEALCVGIDYLFMEW